MNVRLYISHVSEKKVEVIIMTESFVACMFKRFLCAYAFLLHAFLHLADYSFSAENLSLLWLSTISHLLFNLLNRIAHVSFSEFQLSSLLECVIW